MTRPSDESAPTQSTRWLRALLFVTGFVCYALSATPGAFWLDSSELAAASASLGVPHAPGHPLYVLLGHAASLIPIGPLGFRITLLSALCGAWAVVLLFDVAMLLMPTTSYQPKARAHAAAIVALVFAMSEALWLQSVRAEVYTLHLVCALWLTRLGLQWFVASTTPNPGPDWLHKPLIAAFILGLAAGNHHYLLLFHVPCLLLLFMATPQAREKALRLLPLMALLALVGLGIYALLPLRAATDPPINYGDPQTIGRFWGVLSAQMFQSAVAVDTSITANLVGAGEMFFRSIGLLILLAPIGLVLIGRYHRSLAAAILLGLVANLATKVLMDLDPENPDAAGYFQLGIALVAALAAPPLARIFSASKAWTGLVTAGLCVSLTAYQVTQHLPRTWLQDMNSPASFDASLVLNMPPRAVIMPSLPFLAFNRLYHQVIEGSRPDMTMVHQGGDWGSGVEGGAPFATLHVRRDPALKAMMTAWVNHKRFPRAEVLDLATTRPVFLEPVLEHLPMGGDAKPDGGYLKVSSTVTIPSTRQHLDRWLRASGPELREQRDARRNAKLYLIQLADAGLRLRATPVVIEALEGLYAIGSEQRVQRLLEQARALAVDASIGSPDFPSLATPLLTGIRAYLSGKPEPLRPH